MLKVLGMLMLQMPCSMAEDDSASDRGGRLLFNTGFVQKQIGDISTRLDSMETRSRSLPQGGVAGGYETFNDAKANFTRIYSNITNIYEKIQMNRKTVQGKCSRQRCDMILGKVKKVKTQVEFLQNTNITVLEELLKALQNTSMVSQISSLQSQVTAMTENATAQQAEIDTLKTQVTSLESTVTSLQTKVTTLENTTTTNTEDIDKIGEGPFIHSFAVPPPSPL